MEKSKDGNRRASHIQPLFEPQDAESFRRQCSGPDAEAGCKKSCQEACKTACKATCELQCKTGCEIVYK